MRVVITGAAGFIGSRFAEMFLERAERLGYDDIVLLDALTYSGRRENMDAVLRDSRVTFVEGSIGDEEVTSSALRGAHAVVHFAAIPRIMITPDNEVFRINTMGTYNVIEAAVKLGIKKVIIASSETTFGIVFNYEPRDPVYLPLDEEYPVDPPDSYALSKVCNEATAKSFATRTGADIYAIRIGNVIEPHEYANFPGFFQNPEGRKRIMWSYIDARDLGQLVLKAIETDGLGYQVFNAAQDDCSSDLPTAELLRRFYPNVPVKSSLGEYETLLSNRKAKQMLGFQPEHSWRRALTERA